MGLAALSLFWLFLSSPPACVSFRESCIAVHGLTVFVLCVFIMNERSHGKYRTGESRGTSTNRLTSTDHVSPHGGPHRPHPFPFFDFARYFLSFYHLTQGSHF